MQMITVETTGSFMLLDLSTGSEIAAEGPSTVPVSEFVRDRIELGQLREVKPEPAPAAEGKKAAKPKAE